MSKVAKLLTGLALFTFLAVTTTWAQGIFATLTGVVSDPSGALVSGAKISLRDTVSGSLRDTITNAEGYYTFASVPVGTYALSVEAPGFQVYKADQIRLGGGERRNTNVTLTVGTTSQTVEVTGEQDFAVATTDSGEKSFTLESKELQNFVQVGSNAAEYIKITPGFGVNNGGASNKANYNGQTIGINANGDAGSQSPLNNAFSYNGLPSNVLDITADGAHVSDPGCNCDTPVNPNSDFLQEFRVLTSNFSAETQKGPAVISSVTKSGGQQFHGSGFFSARNYVLNANDWLNNNQTPIVQQPHNSYYYPGFTLGGPVRIPGTSFNKNRDKLFFFTGYEYFHQVLDTGLLRAIVPTDAEINGDFSPGEIANEGPGGNPTNANFTTAFGPGGQIPSSAIDPNMQALMKLYPRANSTPSLQNPFNYAQAEVFNQNNFQWTTRVDYNISDNTKIFVRYNMQRETQLFPVGLWWRQTDQVPYPTPVEGKNRSSSWSGTLTHVFSPTMTNEVVMAYTFVGFPNIFADPKKVNRSSVGFGYAGLSNNGVAQIPSFGGNGGAGEAALIFQPGGFEAGGPSAGLYANKYMPSVSDTLTKVVRNHTLKAGFFYEWIRNTQPANNNTNGYMQFVPSANTNFTYGNAYADMLTGNMSNYNEGNFNRLNDISYHTVEGFIQDSWKLRRKLTVELGLRLTHFTPWADDEGFGYSIFDRTQYQGASCTSGPTFCGFQWRARDKSVPISGFPSRTLFYQPRFGLAYDIFGTGKTVLRGGWGRFYFHSGQFTSGLDTSAGAATVSITPTTIPNQSAQPLFAKNLASIGFTGLPPTPTAVDRKDDRQPYTDSYSLTIAERLPWSSLLEVAYVGNQSNDLQNYAGAGSNINLVPIGAITSDPAVTDAANANANNYRPLLGYNDINIATNNLYANYNALQVTWARHAGRYTLQANYSYQKALGIVSPSTNQATLNPFNLRSNYGIQPSDRRQLFNVAYSIELGNPLHGHKFLGGAVNGWQISGITQLESGANLTYANGTNDHFNMQLTGVTRSDGITVNNQSLLGTNAIQLNPIVTCDPRSGLGSHQFINPNCFSVPTAVGQNGPTLLPAVYGPSYFSSDLGLFKNFQITESKKLQFRIQAYNFLNHPLWSFPDTSNLTLKFAQDSTGAITQTNSTFGTSTSKQGNRVVELAVKFFF